jgi:Calcineurin-like phosphoesterase
MTLKKVLICLSLITAVSTFWACLRSVEDNKRSAKFVIGLLPDTQGGTDAGGQAHVALHPMNQVLQHQSDFGVDMVIALGDLTDKGSTVEWQEWRSTAERYSAQGIEFFPVMGNHEVSNAYAVEWIDNMRHVIARDAIHMPRYEWLNYYVIRENVLIVGLAYYNLPIAFNWIQDVVAKHKSQVDHIVIASHDGLIGIKYGLTREQIVDGSKNDDWVYNVQAKIRQFFSEHDVIYVQGHEHQYQRSLISATNTLQTLPSGFTPSGGNYRMNMYTQIIAGNASYKGYEFRYGERELVQWVVSQKNATFNKSSGSNHLDVNSSLLTFNGQRVDYASYFAEHQTKSNVEAERFDAEWSLLDQFSRTTQRCESVIYPNSLLTDTRAVLVYQTQYITSECNAEDGSSARLIGGVNATFNRVDSRTESMAFTPGFSRAETLMDLTRLVYQWMYIPHASWTPNLNSPSRVTADTKTNTLIIPQTTMDLKEHVTLSWYQATHETVSDILIISGTQNQTGIYQGAYGSIKDIELDSGLDNSQTQGGKKSPISLPKTASKRWSISDAQADAYVLELSGGQVTSAGQVLLAQKGAAQWTPLATAECVINAHWSEEYLTNVPSRAKGCKGQPLVGVDLESNRWWAVLNRDVEVALIAR